MPMKRLISCLALTAAFGCTSNSDPGGEGPAAASPEDFMPVYSMCEAAIDERLAHGSFTADEELGMYVGCSLPFNRCIATGDTDMDTLCKSRWSGKWTNAFRSCTTAAKAEEYCKDLDINEMVAACLDSVLLVRQLSVEYCRDKTYPSCAYGPVPPSAGGT